MNLYVVDCFDQTRKLIDNVQSTGQAKVIASALLSPAPAAYHALFSPRLAQPARLNLDWQPAGDASLGPVCGWIVANYLEKSFAVFSASGEPLGSLESVLPALGNKTIGSKVKFQWCPIPGSSLKIEGISNPRLRRFVSLAASLSADEGQALLELVDLVLRRTEGRVPAEDPAVAVLLGRPLALVQAALSLEVEGLPAGYWKRDDARNLKFETEGWEKLRVPVRLGAMNLASDGLVGYLPEPRNENDPPSLVASDGAKRRLDSTLTKIKYDQDLTVASDDKEPVAADSVNGCQRPGACEHRAAAATPGLAAGRGGAVGESDQRVLHHGGPGAGREARPRCVSADHAAALGLPWPMVMGHPASSHHLAADRARRRPGAVRGGPGAHRRLAAAAAKARRHAQELTDFMKGARPWR